MNWRPLSLSLLLTAACGTAAAPAQPVTPAPAPSPESAAPAAENTSISIGEVKSMKSAILGEERRYLVHVPPGYEGGTVSYPVIYMTDGAGHFHHITGIMAFLSSQDRMPQAIVVGVPNTNRTRDLTPTKQSRLPASGGSAAFLEFFEKELVPQIEREYRTVPLRIFIGHSFGGLFAVSALTSKPTLFDAHIAASPSLQWDDKLMAKRIAPLLANGLSGFLFFTLGTEGADITEGNKHFAELLEKSAPESFRWRFELMADEDHGSVVHRTVYRGLEMFFGEYPMPRTVSTAAEVKAHYKSVASKFKLDARPPEGVVNILGYRHMQATPPNMESAIELFELNVELYPNSANVYDSLGEALERGGKLDEALASYEKAVANSKPGEPFHDVFVKNRDRVAKKVAPAPVP